MPGLLENGRSKLLFVVFALICAEGMAAGAAAVATRGLFNALHGSQSLSQALMYTLAASGFAIAACRVSARTLGERMGQYYALDIRRALFDQGTAMSSSDVNSRRAGYMSLRFVGDLTAFRNWLGLGLPRLLAALVLVPVTLGVLYWMHPPFLTGIAPLFLLALVAIGLGGFKLRALQRRVRSRRAAIAADMAERMPIAPALGQLGRRRQEVRRIDKRSARLIKAALARIRHAEWLKSMPDMVAGCAALAIIWTGSQHNLDTGTIAGALSAVGIALKPMRDLATVWNHGAAFSAAHSKCVAALNRPRRRESAKGKQLQQQGGLSLRFNQFPVAAGNTLNEDIRAGQRVQLSGSNGSGKSSLIRILCGLDAAQPGQVYIGHQDLTTLSQGTLRRQVVQISSDITLLKGSLRKALTMGLDKRPDDARLKEAITQAGMSLDQWHPDGLDSEVAEAGRNLSAGTRVKLSLARALLIQPGLLLIDGSAAQLDTAGQQALQAWLGSHTSTVIASEQFGGMRIHFDHRLCLDSFRLAEPLQAQN